MDDSDMTKNDGNADTAPARDDAASGDTAHQDEYHKNALEATSASPQNLCPGLNDPVVQNLQLDIGHHMRALHMLDHDLILIMERTKEVNCELFEALAGGAPPYVRVAKAHLKFLREQAREMKKTLQQKRAAIDVLRVAGVALLEATELNTEGHTPPEELNTQHVCMLSEVVERIAKSEMSDLDTEKMAEALEQMVENFVDGRPEFAAADATSSR